MWTTVQTRNHFNEKHNKTMFHNNVSLFPQGLSLKQNKKSVAEAVLILQISESEITKQLPDIMLPHQICAVWYVLVMFILFGMLLSLLYTVVLISQMLILVNTHNPVCKPVKSARNYVKVYSFHIEVNYIFWSNVAGIGTVV